VTESNGIEVVHISVRGGLVTILSRLVRATAAFAPHVVHVFKPMGYSAAVAQIMFIVRRFGYYKPLVMDTDDWEGAGGWNDALPRTSWQKKLIAWQENWCYRHSDAITVASQALRTIALSMGVPPNRLFYVPNALQEPLRAPRAREVARLRQKHRLGDETVLLYTRFAEFPATWPVQFLKRLKRYCPEAKLLVVGAGLHGEHKALQECASDSRLCDDIVITGWVDPETLPDYLATATVAIVPFADSLIARSKCSVKTLELMSVGLPIVASAVGENVANLAYGKAGVLVDGPLAAERWAREVASLLRNQDRRHTLSAASSERLRREYLWEKIIGRVEAAYQEALAGKPPQSQ